MTEAEALPGRRKRWRPPCLAPPLGHTCSAPAPVGAHAHTLPQWSVRGHCDCMAAASAASRSRRLAVPLPRRHAPQTCQDILPSVGTEDDWLCTGPDGVLKVVRASGMLWL